MFPKWEQTLGCGAQPCTRLWRVSLPVCVAQRAGRRRRCRSRTIGRRAARWQFVDQLSFLRFEHTGVCEKRRARQGRRPRRVADGQSEGHEDCAGGRPEGKPHGAQRAVRTGDGAEWNRRYGRLAEGKARSAAQWAQAHGVPAAGAGAYEVSHNRLHLT